MTGTTDASWPDQLEHYLLQRDTEFHVVKRKYFELPTPRLNWFKNRWLARGLANELAAVIGERSEVSGQRSETAVPTSPQPSPPAEREKAANGTTQGTDPSGSACVPYSLWFVAHSNGAVVSLMAARLLIARGYRIGGMIMTGAAIEADLRENRIFNWWCGTKLFAAIAYSSPDDEVVAGDPRAVGGHHPWWRLRDWCMGKLMWPYGCLGRTGWLLDGKPLKDKAMLYTRWQAGGHSTYFTAANIRQTFDQMYSDIQSAEEMRGRTAIPTSPLTPLPQRRGEPDTNL